MSLDRRFNVLDQSWIPVIGPRGPEVVGVRDALVRAGELELATPNPLEWTGVLRQLLLPIVIDSLGVPEDDEDWVERWNVGAFDSDKLDAYLDEHADRFNLFDRERPFAQVGGLEALSGDTRPCSLLLAATPTGNNVPLFAGRDEGDAPALPPAAAARALLATLCWDTAAIKTGARGDPRAKAGKTTGNPTGPLGQLGLVVPAGRTLFETIIFSIPIWAGGIDVGDSPWWRREPPSAAWEARPARGVLDQLTWQSRRILLIPEDDDDDGLVVRRVIVAAGDRLSHIDKDIEPHTVWRQVDNPKAGDPSHRPVRHQSGRALWRGLPGLLAVGSAAGLNSESKVQAPAALAQIGRLRGEGLLPPELPLDVVSIGVEYGNQSAVVENTMADRIPLPLVALDDETVRDLLIMVVTQADDARTALNFLANDLRRSLGAEPVPRDKSQRPGDQLLFGLDALVRRLLAGAQREPGRVSEGYDAWLISARATTLAAAQPVLDAMPPDAFLGRVDMRSDLCLAIAEQKFNKRVREIFPRPAAVATVTS